MEVISFSSIMLSSGDREVTYGPARVSGDLSWSRLFDSHSEESQAQEIQASIWGADLGTRGSTGRCRMSLITSFARHKLIVLHIAL